MAMIEDDTFEITEDEDENKRCREGSEAYQHIRALPTFSLQDWQRVLDTVQRHHPKHFGVVHTMVDLRLPLVAVLGLSIGDLDFPNGTVRVVQGWGETGAFPIPNLTHPFHPHGDLGHLVIPMTPKSQQVFLDQLAQLRACGRPCGPTDWVFPGRGNQPWKFRYVTNGTILPALEQCELPKLYPKDLYYCLYKTHIKEACNHEQHR